MPVNLFYNEFENQQSKDTIDFISSLVKVTMKMHVILEIRWFEQIIMIKKMECMGQQKKLK